MERGRTLGLIVTGGAPLPGDVAVGQDPALTPFAGQYRFIDFALATLRNSGVADVRVMAPGPAAVGAHLDAIGRPPGCGERVKIVGLPTPPSSSRAARLRQALARCRRLLAREPYDAVVVLLADHVLHVDLRHLLAAHGDGAAVTLAALPVPREEARDRTVLRVTADGRVDEIRTGLPAEDDGNGLALSWAGDLVISLPGLEWLPADGPGPWDDRRLLQPLIDTRRLQAFDVIGGRPTGTGSGAAGYWHEPTTLEAYYDAQMDLCRLRAVLDLYDPSWPVYPAASGLGPAKVVADAAGRAAHAVNTLVSDGAIIRGAMVVNGVLGQGVVVESGAEVEDTVLLDGCRIGRNARVRRAVVGAGAVVGDGEEIGFSTCVLPHARVERSGLTVLPAVPAAR